MLIHKNIYIYKENSNRSNTMNKRYDSKIFLKIKFLWTKYSALL